MLTLKDYTLVVLCAMFTSYFVDPDLRLEIFFEKKRG